MKRKTLILSLVVSLFFIIISINSTAENNIDTGYQVLNTLQMEMMEEISPYHYLRMEFYQNTSRYYDFESTLKHEELEDKLLDDIEDAFEDTGENLLKSIFDKSIEDTNIDRSISKTSRHFRLSIYRQRPTIEETRTITVDAGLVIDKDYPFSIGGRFRSINDGPGLCIKWQRDIKGARGLNRHDLVIFPKSETIHYRISSFFGWPGIKLEYNWGKEKIKLRLKDIPVGEDKYIAFGTSYDFKKNNFGLQARFFGQFRLSQIINRP